jgi:uncharacterized protein YvpB
MKDKSTLFAVMIFTIIILLSVFTSCTSKSGERAKTPEKVVIIDEDPTNIYDDYYTYKIKRIDHGVIDKIISNTRFDVGDTIYHKF